MRHRITVPFAADWRSITWPLAAAALLCIGALPACSEKVDPPPPPDAKIEVQCWSGGGTPTAGASATLGTGNDEFVPLEPEQGLPLYPGPQGGAHFFLNVRISGLLPGDVSGRTAPPTYTRLTIHGEDGTDMTLEPCNYPLPYSDDGEGSFDMGYGRLVRIGTPFLTSAYGQRVLLRAEVLDWDGRYASDERWVVVTNPTETGDAGTGDAGTGDAGVEDASASASR